MTLKLMEDQPQFTQMIGERGSWIKVSLIQSHTTANSALTMKCFLANCSTVEITDLPHSRDLEPAEFFISQREKCPQQMISEYKNIRKNIPAKLNAVLLDIFSDIFIHLFKIHKKCVIVKGVQSEQK